MHIPQPNYKSAIFIFRHQNHDIAEIGTHLNIAEHGIMNEAFIVVVSSLDRKFPDRCGIGEKKFVTPGSKGEGHCIHFHFQPCFVCVHFLKKILGDPSCQ